MHMLFFDIEYRIINSKGPDFKENVLNGILN